jgi:hypothetical protein
MYTGLVAAAVGRAATTMKWLATTPVTYLNTQAHRLNWTRHNLLYRGDANDLFLSTYPKSGTTLLQMLIFQLTTDGSVQVRHIRDFSPFVDDVIRIEHPQRTLDALPRPHVFKSHLTYPLTPKGPGRYIYLMRNGLDVAASFHHMRARVGFTRPFEDYFDAFVSGDGGPLGTWFDHVAGWLANRQRLNVLYLTYEDLRRDFERTARRVADFCGVTVPESAWPRITDHCSFAYMRQHESMFAPSPLPVLDPDNLHFIRRGRIGDGLAAATPQMVERFNAACAKAFRDVAAPAHLSAREHVAAG